jgi:thiosulfate/3-mercaptopyruvate sulfurtransferase
MSPFIESEVLATLLTDPRVIVLDARFSFGHSDGKFGQNLYHQGHIPGARYIDLEADLSAPVIPGKTSRHPLPDPEIFSALLCKLGIDTQSHIVVYDDGGHAMAARAWWQLRWIGIKRVQVLHGGIKSWSRYPLTTEIPAIEPTSFSGSPDISMTVSAEDIVNQLDKPIYRLIDARAPERFAGDVEPLDDKAGHIPGAVCHPFTQNMDESGFFLSPEELGKTFGSLMESLIDDNLEPVFYCGSGVTACHNLLAMEYAGMTGARLYPGSWSEWITDSSRPIATGQS